METIKEILLVYGRIITILPLLLVATLFMGKRSIGELPVFDFLIIICLGAVVGADIADPKIEHIHTGMAVIALALLQRLIAYMNIKFRKVGRLLTFEPTLIILDGVFLVKNLRKIHYSLDNILQMLREKEIFDVTVVHLGFIEANGRLSVLKKAEQLTATRQDLGLKIESKELSYPVIIEGKIDYETLSHLNTNETWLKEQLNKKGFKKTEEIFYASLDKNFKLHISPNTSSTPDPLKH
ncbi:DUF421 domain-containing protein [Bacillus sp. MRMR6]|uniref:DUF421 domain-containing protein n=1 Tax=Bacillus sp. MRMR6 TaxID=1928617 RepID=UPI0009530F7C|nr:DUF421 domain-containing protein [Bacillus sp. MRMR6]OLS40395.1 DUF421 domain-containing protein [Bacillus sp. MRMR6]